MRIRSPLILALAVGIAACASTGERRELRQPNLLTEEQLQEGNHFTAFEAVRSLRPSWLRERPMSISNPEGAEVVVYVDGVRMAAGLESLRQLRTDTIVRMEYMTPSDATTRFGTGHVGGAILVTTRRG